ncbi:MAG: DUF1697 domain-containing protein [Acidobacteria bacterium]|nr:DUF1697 domain-containing protein [Acidobacteriota bacterium]MCA1601077.1 DUF1697 domain-containing protein [Acidobacteriota bacterium]
MPKYVAFLRAVNVGGHIIKMDHLRQLFQSLGFSNVETFIASGNVIFDTTSKSTKTLETKIESLLRETFGYRVATFVRSTSELAKIAEYKPFGDSELGAEGNALYIAFTSDEPSAEAKRKLLIFTTDVDDFDVYGREVYWLSRKKISESKFSGAQLERTLGMPATIRNANTVKKIALKYALFADKNASHR